MIAKQTANIAAATKAEVLKKELEAFLKSATSAAAKYNQGKYDDLVRKWLIQDAEIARLIQTIVCTYPCWKCVLECYVCPLLNDLHYQEQCLYGKTNGCTAAPEAHNLYDLQYWYSRDVAAKQRQFDRIASVIKVWGSPAESIDKALTDNKTLYDKIDIGKEPGKAIYDVFVKLVPMHLAIAPPATSETTTKIDEKYTKFCECSHGTHDHCCGPDVGKWSLRNRLIAPQPYLIDPKDYIKLICCLVEHRYLPARDALNKAGKDYAEVNARITQYETQFKYDDKFKEAWAKTFEGIARPLMPAAIKCCDYSPDSEDE